VNGYYKLVKENAKEVGLDKVLIPDTSDQQRGLAAALTALSYGKEKSLIAKEMGVTVRSVDRYLKFLTSPGKGDIQRLIKPTGRPRKYPAEVDALFVEWAANKDTPLNQKTMDDMITKCATLLQEHEPGLTRDGINFNRVRQHIYGIMKILDWCMVKPKTIDLERCAIYSSMVRWFHDEKVKEALTGVDPLLLFNADETQINLNSKAVRKVLWIDQDERKNASVPAASRISSHLTLFLAVSATGNVMKPSVLIHENPKKGFNPLPSRDLVCYHSTNGCMEKERFYTIMKDVFVKHVESVRRDNGLPGRRAVLVVDGHISRFSVRFWMD